MTLCEFYRPWALPDFLAYQFRLVVLCPKLENRFVLTLQSRLNAWAIRLDKVVELGMSFPREDYFGWTEFRVSSRRFWNSLSGWNGFAHAASLAGRWGNGRRICQEVTLGKEPRNLIYGHRFIHNIAFFNYAACLVQSLSVSGQQHEAVRVSQSVLEQLLAMVRQETSASDSSGSLIQNEVVRLLCDTDNDSAAPTVWGGEQRGILQSLIVLLKAIPSENWTFVSECFDLSYGLSLVSPAISRVDPVTLTASPESSLAIICILSPVNESSVTVQVRCTYICACMDNLSVSCPCVCALRLTYTWQRMK